MNGQMRKFDYQKYRKQLETMSGPIGVNELPNVILDLRGLHRYALEKGVPIASLSDDEKNHFMKAK